MIKNDIVQGGDQAPLEIFLRMCHYIQNDLIQIDLNKNDLNEIDLNEVFELEGA